VLTHGLLDRLERTDLEVGVGAELPADPEHEGGALHWHADHDANGNVTERTDPKSVTVVARYGLLDRLETERYPEPFLNPTYPYPLGVTYAYDGNGNVELVTELKRTSAETTVEEVRDPEYDGLGRLASERRYDGKVVTYRGPDREFPGDRQPTRGP